MGLHHIQKGLDLPITGKPLQQIDVDGPAKALTRVAVLADDFIGMKPRMMVNEGDEVRRGQALFEDRKRPGVLHTATAAGKVVAIHRGDKRALRSVVIELNERERAGDPTDADFQPFEAFTGRPVAELSRDEVRALLVESGAWTGLRARPFSRVPPVDQVPSSIFVTALNTHPLAADPAVAVAGQQAALEAGLAALGKLTDGSVYLCRRPGADVGPGLVEGVKVEEFSGPHPAGLPGTHIHLIDPVSREKTVWYISLADVVMAGAVMLTGKLHPERVLSIGGPMAVNPRLIRARLGAPMDELLSGEVKPGEVRWISGSVLGGRACKGDVLGFLGRYDSGLSLIAEERTRHFLGWLTPGENSFSLFPIYLSKLFGGHDFDFTTTTNGSPRAMVPIGMYEDVMPLDILPTFLLRSLASGDLERSEQLGALELDEEDLALCTMVCPGKNDYGAMLRQRLDTIEREG